jgi:hypothetical protein
MIYFLLLAPWLQFCVQEILSLKKPGAQRFRRKIDDFPYKGAQKQPLSHRVLCPFSAKLLHNEICELLCKLIFPDQQQLTRRNLEKRSEISVGDEPLCFSAFFGFRQNELAEDDEGKCQFLSHHRLGIILDSLCNSRLLKLIGLCASFW